ncbi:MAG TPA: DUF4424 domain-containing protein [Stellaceae bacterium]|nr:DUF4424 domain-containing protein [Stellaceae bacterium]
MRTAAAVLAIGLAYAGPALANDSSAELAAGGLVFIQNPNVEMASEELFVSPPEIRVTYHFFNKSDQDVTNLVAFPMPDITFASEDTNLAIPTADPQNFLGFSTKVNGKPVTAQIEQKVFAKGVDQTALLQQLGIPLAPQSPATGAALDALPKDKWQQLIDLGLVEMVEYEDTPPPSPDNPGAPGMPGGSGMPPGTSGSDAGAAAGPGAASGGPGADAGAAPAAPSGGVPPPSPGMKQHLDPRWTLKTTYFWQQTFPAHQETIVEHRYQPSVGESVETLIGNPQFPDHPEYQKKYCMSPDFLAAASKAWQQAAKTDSRQYAEERIDYVLSTGANWAGPIGDFTLIVDKGDSNALVSFCATGVEQLSPTQYKLHLTNFTPPSDLAILILTKQPIQY